MIRKIAKSLATPLGLEGTLRRGYVELMRSGERLRFALRGEPEASSAIVLAASGRSGTTWLADVLSRAARAQHVFEPLEPRSIPAVRALTGWGEEPRIRAWYLRAEEASPQWLRFWEDVLRGRVRNYWTDYKRTALLPRRFLVKVIRANLMLGFVHESFAPVILHMVRHPCAVIASRLQGRWQADVRDLLCQDALVEDFLRPWLPEIEAERDALGAHAVWWAVENAVAVRQLVGRGHHRVFYEDLQLAPRRQMQQLLSALDLDAPSPAYASLVRPSRTTSYESLGTTAAQRLSRWRSLLGSKECRRILAWAKRFDLDWYDEDPLPRHAR